MKKMNLKYILAAALVMFATSACEDQLDINENPNAPTAADVQLVLPQAITASANIASQFNTHGAHFGGFAANAGGFSGFGNLLNYNLTPIDWNAMWVNTYQDPLTDLKYVVDNTQGKPELAYFNAAAKIMMVVNFQRLVDAWGDIPYSEALRGSEGIVTAKYDDAATIYRDLYAKLDEAIATINGAGAEALRLTRATDPLFGSNDSGERPAADQVADWKKYANTLKLRILIRVSGVPSFASFVTEGAAALEKNFLASDAIVDPGYELNRPSPAWAAWGRNIAGTLSGLAASRIPTRFAFGFYNGKLTDPARGEVIFANYPTTPINQLGNEDGAPTVIPNTVTWASNQAGYTGRGILKGPAQGMPLMTAAESYFLQAEANLRGIYGNASAAEALFDAGITASFTYLFLDENETLGTPAGTTIASLVSAYKSANSGSRLVNYASATSDAQRLEAIITQKYIALNLINSEEAWNEYRRTGFPATTAGGAAINDIASNKSSITSRPDRLPTRILYPSSEQSFNAENFVSIDPTSHLIFWDPN
jgi:hypothetical protein